jgi:hypothetical protein
MDKDLFDQIIEFLLPEMDDANDRKTLVQSALHKSPALLKIQWGGAARPFTVQLVRLLDQFGEVTPGKPAVVALLEEARAQVGADRQAQIDILLAQIKTSLTKSASPENIQPRSKTHRENEMDRTTFANGHASLIGVGADLQVTVSDATASGA